MLSLVIMWGWIISGVVSGILYLIISVIKARKFFNKKIDLRIKIPIFIILLFAGFVSIPIIVAYANTVREDV